MRSFTIAALGVLAASICLAVAPAGVETLDGKPANVIGAGQVDVLLFLRTDCPLGKRYAPELDRISKEFASKPVKFWLVFPDKTESASNISGMVTDYRFPGSPVRDIERTLVRAAHATVAPEAAVFGRDGKLLYHGRIDDQYVDYGKQKPEPQVHDLENAISAAMAGKPVAEPETRAFGCSLADVE
jgi:hypothetical protein